MEVSFYFFSKGKILWFACVIANDGCRKFSQNDAAFLISTAVVDIYFSSSALGRTQHP
ncbi:hypothetical protein HRE53_21725 [Acaryochloris sp. 'Moss Beach']|uniref:hypothetical protein n=1 Tax=Acaryochloris sp. 'Moss Beach' TaxID=2740837 RepID=UPI001F44DDBC|nr:hypothetical protein [Acaryochloris sp. 'Moss Beach']UJB69013.1 hypothetical protein HRE53_21725 [Acaryochloris sp. 'Moss Beach']